MTEYKFGDLIWHENIGVGRFVAMEEGWPNFCHILRADGRLQTFPVRDLNPHTTADTVEVRIAVAVDRDGTHAVRACYEVHSDSDTERRVAEDLRGWGGLCRVSFVTARVPLPFKTPDVVGEVKP
jgi:hypothetical protein